MHYIPSLSAPWLSVANFKEMLANIKPSGTSPVPQAQQMKSQKDRIARAYDEPELSLVDLARLGE